MHLDNWECYLCQTNTWACMINCESHFDWPVKWGKSEKNYCWFNGSSKMCDGPNKQTEAFKTVFIRRQCVRKALHSPYAQPNTCRLRNAFRYLWHIRARDIDLTVHTHRIKFKYLKFSSIIFQTNRAPIWRIDMYVYRLVVEEREKERQTEIAKTGCWTSWDLTRWIHHFYLNFDLETKFKEVFSC